MKKTLLLIAGAALVVIAVLAALFATPERDRRASLTENMFVPADNDAFDPGPTVGSHFPGLRARYLSGDVTMLEPFAGRRGTVLVASRSFAWCPFCMKQMAHLQQHKALFDAAGIGLVAITYDAPETQQAFAEKFGISIPLVSDIDALSFKTLGILNQDYSPGDEHYGIPYPGMIVVDNKGKVVGKLFLDGYSTRLDSAAALRYAKGWLGIK